MKRSLEGGLVSGGVIYGSVVLCPDSGAPIPLHRFPMTKYDSSSSQIVMERCKLVGSWLCL